jgi:hypothetical protein
MNARTASMLSLLATLMAVGTVGAEPRNTVWLEDIRLEPEGNAETALSYEFQAPDLKAIEEGTDLFSLRLNAGVTDAFEVAPVVRLRQRGNEELRIHELGGEGRYRLIGDALEPRLIVYGGYMNDLGEDRDHRVFAGGGGRYDVSRLLLGADLRASGGLGGEEDGAAEIWLGLTAGYSLLPDRQLTAAIETFAVTPVGGKRISDPTFGEAGESISFYYGPTLSLRGGPIWTAVSGVTGFPVSDPASHLLLRWMVGVNH